MFDWVELLETGRKVAGLDAQLGVDDELFDGVRALETLRSLVDAAEGHLLAELHTRGASDTMFGLRTGAWLAHVAVLPSAVAKARVGVAVKLRDRLPLVAEALACGDINWEQARVLADLANPRIVDRVAAEQEMLLASTVGMRFEHWRSYVRALGVLWDEDGGYDPKNDEAANKLSYAETLDGLLQLTATLTGERAEVVKQGIEAKTDELFRQAVADHKVSPELEVPSRATLRAFALEELVRQALGVDVTLTKAPRTAVTLIVKADEPDTVLTPDGVRLADGTSRRLLCDPDLYAVVVDSLGVPIDLGRHVRWATEAQRRAAGVRDGGCIFPGCSAPIRWCDLHHCDHWEHGGRTDLTNLSNLCRHHHAVVHRDGWHLHHTKPGERDGGFWFQTPNGHTFWAQHHGHQRQDSPPPPATAPTAGRRTTGEAAANPKTERPTGTDPPDG